jgi:hypothetical protein
MSVEHLLKGFREILQQVKPIRHLGGLWRPLTDTVGIRLCPLAGNDLHPRMRAEPLGQGFGLPIGQDGDGPTAFQFNQHRAISLTFAEREIVHA